jgi:hypothetical protein
MKEDYGGCEETDPDMLDLQMLIFNCNLPTGTASTIPIVSLNTGNVHNLANLEVIQWIPFPA